MNQDLKAAGREAIARLERASREHPDVKHEDIKDAVACVIAFRDLALARHRDGGGDRTVLDRANALVSLAYGCVFPLAGVHRHRIEQTRDAMKDLLAASGGNTGRPSSPRG
jgi:hypothetical protein